MLHAAKQLVLVIGLGTFATACLPVIAGGLIYRGVRSNEERQEFMANFRETNAQREADGLTPLNWCSEVYRFDRGWAMDDPNCEARVRAYEAGDTNAFSVAQTIYATACAGQVPRATRNGGAWTVELPVGNEQGGCATERCSIGDPNNELTEQEAIAACRKMLAGEER